MWLAAVVVVAAGLLAVGVYVLVSRGDSGTEPTAMARRAQQVMPFDLSRTTHTFTETPRRRHPEGGREGPR